MEATTTPKPAKLLRSSHLMHAVQGGRLHVGRGWASRPGGQVPEGAWGSTADAAWGGMRRADASGSSLARNRAGEPSLRARGRLPHARGCFRSLSQVKAQVCAAHLRREHVRAAHNDAGFPNRLGPVIFTSTNTKPRNRTCSLSMAKIYCHKTAR